MHEHAKVIYLTFVKLSTAFRYAVEEGQRYAVEEGQQRIHDGLIPANCVPTRRHPNTVAGLNSNIRGLRQGRLLRCTHSFLNQSRRRPTILSRPTASRPA